MNRWFKSEDHCHSVVMWGAGDQARVNKHILDELGVNLQLLVDDTEGKLSPFTEIQLLHGSKFEAVSKDYKGMGFVVAIGNPYGHVRQKIHVKLKADGLVPYQLIDPSSLICKTVTLQEGVQLMPGAIVHSYAHVGVQCIVNTKALVEHDCILSAGVEIGPGVTLCGRVEIGENTWIGAGSVIRPRVKVGKNVIIGAGSVVVNDIPDGVVAFGCPAKPSKLPPPPPALI